MDNHGDTLEKIELIPIEDVEAEIQKQKETSQALLSGVGKCRLQIVDANQVGIEGTNVFLFEKKDSNSTFNDIYDASNCFFVDTFITNKSGELEFEINPQKNNFIVVQKDGFAVSILEIDNYRTDTIPQSVILKQADAIYGQVLSKDGNPVEDANISIILSDPNSWRNYNITDLISGFRLVTDSNGLFVGTFISKSQNIDVVINKEGFSRTFATNHPIYGNQQQLKVGKDYLPYNKIYLDRYGKLVVSVIDELTNKPIANAQVQVSNVTDYTDFFGKYTAKADSNGIVVFEHLPIINCKVTLSPEFIIEDGNIATRSCSLLIKADKTSQCQLKTVSVKDLNVFVIDANNEPVEKVNVYIRLSVIHQDEDFTDFQTQAVTNNQGLAKLRVPLNSYLSISLYDQNLGERVYRLNTGITQDTEVVTLTLKNEDIKPVHKGKVIVPRGFIADDILVELIGAQTSVEADANGNFEFDLKVFDSISEVNKNKKIFVVAMSKKYNLVGIAEVKSLDGLTEVFLQEGATASGYVIDDANQPISQASIGYYSSWKDDQGVDYATSYLLYEYGTSDSNGFYYIDCILPDKMLSVFPQKEGYTKENAVYIEKPVLGIKSVVPIVKLNRCNKALRGRLVNQYDEPKQSWFIDTDYGYAKTDHEGKFIIENVPNGELFLKYSSPDKDIMKNITCQHSEQEVLIRIKDFDVYSPFTKKDGKFIKLEYEPDYKNEVKMVTVFMINMPIPYAKVFLRAVNSEVYFIFTTDQDGQAKLFVPKIPDERAADKEKIILKYNDDQAEIVTPKVMGNYVWEYFIEKIEKPGYSCPQEGKTINISYNARIFMEPIIKYVNFAVINDDNIAISKIRINHTIKDKTNTKGTCLKQYSFKENPGKLPIYTEFDLEDPCFIYEIKAMNNDYYALYNGSITDSNQLTLKLKRRVEVHCQIPPSTHEKKYSVKLANDKFDYSETFFKEHEKDLNSQYTIGSYAPTGLELKLIKLINFEAVSTETFIIPENFKGIYDLGNISFE
jgi:protocatechuate 3,4-dioxygenase beta subunit